MLARVDMNDLSESTETSLAFNDVSMIFPDGTHALDDVSFSCRPGTFTTVVGPSGCGKSTLLKIASGLLEQSAGSVGVDRDRVGYVFQDATLLPWRTVLRNVELLAELNGVSKAERRDAAMTAIETVGLAGFENHHPKRLSGGMRMRVSLARALVRNPSVFLFDEPFGALDEITRERLNDEVQQLFTEKAFAGLFITHSISEAVYMSSEVLVMSARPGRIIDRFEIPFPHPRTPDLRFTPEFGELCGAISEALRGGHQ